MGRVRLSDTCHGLALVVNDTSKHLAQPLVLAMVAHGVPLLPGSLLMAVLFFAKPSSAARTFAAIT